MDKILVINAGSSTIKWKVYDKKNLDAIAEGTADRIGIDGHLTTKFKDLKFSLKKSLSDHTKALTNVLSQLKEHKIINNEQEITSIGHRVVHGGLDFDKSVIINDEVLKKISDLSILAPLHNPNAVKVIKACQTVFGNIKQTATFDTSFHSTIPKVNYTYPINKDLADELKIKKYGFHGTSHRYITEKLEEITSKQKVNFISCHIGNGASLTAIKDSKSFDTTMGLTPLAGIMMGTRSGDIDPSIIKFVMDNKGYSIAEVDTLLNKKSGMLGVSKISSDMRDIEEAISKNNQDAVFAKNLYAQRISDTIAAYANKLENKLDAIVFTAGIGENDTTLRDMVVKKLYFDKIMLNKKLNEQKLSKPRKISTKDSKIDVYVIPTDEELLIAQDNKKLR